MSVRTDSLIQILDTIGAPLIDAVSHVHKNADDEDLQKDAQAVAALLGKVVELSISMKDTLDLKPEEVQNDALRIALAALAGPMVAAQYTQKNGQVPVENDLKRLQSSMQAVLTFADNFTPSEEMATRLGNMAAKGAPADAHQVNIQYVGAFLPVVEAIAAFSFGQAEQKLTMDVADRLVKTAVEMRESLMSGASGDDQKLCELAILRSLGQLYASCHRAESEKLSQNPELAAGATLDTVWKAFDTRAAMLEATIKNIAPGSPSISASASPVPAAPPAAPVMDSSTPPVTPPPVTPPAATPPATPPADGGAGANSSGGNPMGFFAAPGSDAGNAAPPSAAPTAPPTPPPAAEPPPAVPPATPPADGNAQGGSPMGFFAAPGAETPPTEPPAAPPPSAPPVPPPQAEQPAPASPPPAEPPADENGDGGGSPMSFFTKKDDED